MTPEELKKLDEALFYAENGPMVGTTTKKISETLHSFYLSAKTLSQIMHGTHPDMVLVPKDIIEKLGDLIPCASGGTFKTDPADAIIDAAIRMITAAKKEGE